jgi:CRP-like cAMP-binding protein
MRLHCQNRLLALIRARTVGRHCSALAPTGRAMAAVSRFAKGNRLLQTLSADDRALLEPHFTSLGLPLRQHFEYPNKPFENVYFLNHGIASVVAEQPNGAKAEIGIIGCEGMTGTAIVLGNERSANSTYVQAAGQGRQINANKLRDAMDRSRTLHKSLLKFVQVFMVQIAHTAIANARAKLPERLARWLLMAHDRVAGDRLALTHEFLSLMLAVRRAGVTEAVHELEHKGLIETARAEIVVLDRKGLQKVAGNFYGVPEAEYRRLLG